MTEKKIPDTELVEPEGFWPDDSVVAHEPPDDLYGAALENQPAITQPLTAADEHQAGERPTESIRFDPATIENIGKPESQPVSEDRPVDPSRFLADADDHGPAADDPLTLPTPETVRSTPDRSQYISSLEMQFDDDPGQSSESGSTNEAQPRPDPVPFESYMSGYIQPTQPMAEETPSELTQPTDDEQTTWSSQAPPAEERVGVHADEVATRTWLNDPPPASDPFSADPYAPKTDDLWLGQTAPFDEHFDPGEFHAEARDETVRRSGLAWSAGIVFFSSVAFMLFLGWLADLLLGTSPYGMVGGIIFGSVIGFIQFFRITSRIFSSKAPGPEIRSLMSHVVEETVSAQDPRNRPYPPETYPPA